MNLPSQSDQPRSKNVGGRSQNSERPQTSAQKDSKQIDYILVVKENNLPLVKQYVENLQVLGFEIENENGKTVDLIFIKVVISEEALLHFSQVYDIGNEEIRKLTVLYIEPIYPNPFGTPISRILPKVKGEITDAEKIMIVNQVLEKTKFDENDKDFGLSRLIRLGILETAYPLHDGPITADGENVRSLLFHHWSNTGVTHKQQPLDLIYRYFGTEAAFYFAWLEYFNFMLIIPAILGALTFLGSAAYIAFGNSDQIKDVCTTHDVFMCPDCEGHKTCQFQSLSHFCSLAQWSVIFDNRSTVCFAVFMSFWAILFLNLWRRKENKLKMRWNTTIEELDTEIRQTYEEDATYQRRNAVTGELEWYTPKCISTCKYTVTSLACAVLIGIILVTVLVIVALKIMLSEALNLSNNKNLMMHSKIISMCAGSLTQVICIKIFQRFYGPLSIRLTKFENPRTQHDFDNSVLYKRYLLSFTNNYVPLVYLAFFKGSLYNLGHKKIFLSKDGCQPFNCIVYVCVQLAFLMTFKDLAGNCGNIIFLTMKNNVTKLLNIFTKRAKEGEEKGTSDENKMPQWEEEYFLLPTNRYFLTTEFIEMIIKYGFVTFFVAAFPLAPLCALVNNLIELRSDAYKLVRLFRRPVPVAKSGIGAWNGVILSVTYLSTCSNAFVLAFTSDWVPRQIYRFNSGTASLSGYINSTLSKYPTSDYDEYKNLTNLVPYCFYRGNKKSADSSYEQVYTETHWINLTFRFVTVFVFEHIILVCNAVLSYCIPKFPDSVQEQLNLDQQNRRTSRIEKFERTMKKSGKTDIDKFRSMIKLHRE